MIDMELCRRPLDPRRALAHARARWSLNSGNASAFNISVINPRLMSTGTTSSPVITPPIANLSARAYWNTVFTD
jgi:hypothetical protein